MNELASLGLILLIALLAGHLAKLLRVPEVTGYLLAGIALGPSVLGWISPDNLDALEVFSEVALGMILFSIGAVFEFSSFGERGLRNLRIVGVESLLAATLVCAGFLAAGQPWQIAFLLGAIAIETAAASTLMVLRECNAHGPFTDTLTSVFAMNNILCLICFMLVSAAIDISRAAGTQISGGGFYNSLFPLIWQLVGSAALGYLMGFLLAQWSGQVVEHGERLILLAGCILLSVGVCHALELSPLIANLAVGATLVNLSNEGRNLFHSLSHTDPPLYAIFFVIAGADLNITLLGSIGVFGAIYIGGRTLGKFAGGQIGAALAGADVSVKKSLGYALLAQAGLAVGLTLAINRRFPEIAPTVVTIVLSSVIVYEIIGPLAVRWAVMRSGESHKREPALGLE